MEIGVGGGAGCKNNQLFSRCKSEILFNFLVKVLCVECIPISNN